MLVISVLNVNEIRKKKKCNISLEHLPACMFNEMHQISWFKKGTYLKVKNSRL